MKKLYRTPITGKVAKPSQTVVDVTIRYTTPVPKDQSIPTDADLDRMQWVADPHADDAVAAILGPWTGDAETAARLKCIDDLNAVIRTWQNNAGVAAWRTDARVTAPGIVEPLQRYLAAAQSLPPWADPDRIARAETMFMDYGALSVTMLFCASLPECYVVPDLAAVLHATGQLEERCDHRIRTTGAMIFPVMMTGGLSLPNGSGIAQVLKVRLIHATVRNLILRASPEAAVAELAHGVVLIPALAPVQPGDSMQRALHVHGWDLKACALPNNQEELAYTLLTFSYVFLRGMRRLGIAFTPAQEEDYLHAWNVAGYFLGIRRELMVDTMDRAAAFFALMQARGRSDAPKRLGTDPRPQLGGALMGAMKSVIPPGPFKSFPVLLTRRLIEPASSHDLGLDSDVSWISKVLFSMLMGTALGIDAVARLVFSDFSISRLITRAIGYRLTCALLMSQTRDLSVPVQLRPGIRSLIAGWGKDSEASGWMNALEDRMTTPGDWEALERHAPR
jgi:ER-bound oxygenase mpaB/B'/Rubber oxygenase, catalytic domain